MTVTDDGRALADELHELWLAQHPFEASEDGVVGYDHLVPDVTSGGDEQYRLQLLDIQDRARALPTPVSVSVSVSEQVARLTMNAAIQRELDLIENASVEHTVSPTWAQGPAAIFSMAATAAPETPEAVENYRRRCAALPVYLAAHTERLREGQRSGRYPVASLVAEALSELDDHLSGATQPDVLGSASEELRPALQQWRDALATMATRPDEQCGLVHLPGGRECYDRLVSIHTTLTVSAEEIHQIGLDRVAELLAELLERGATIDLPDLESIFRGFALSHGGVSAETAMAQAREAIARAEAACVPVFPSPLPPPCEVAAMAAHLGRNGFPPHYTPPKDSRRGTFWFNSQIPETGSGWSLETLAFHEAVPGHHLQFSRAQGLDVSRLQAEGSVTAHSEGWGLYAEVLAGELGLYSSTEAWLGTVAGQLFRAARLVVDTGIHALGWGRAQAVEWFTDTVPLPQAFAEAEIDRYIANPGQALAYQMGLIHILRLRTDAQAAMGDAFDLVGFHTAVLDHGAITLPAVAVSVEGWVREAV